ncbi:hypothetical protein LSUB1_G001995 [Lachnellula subtilissima]|uniref:Low temperature requirement protein A n=1 Tax=Lachnellula subtilissima TaxID=602034 RepID=A0A8H8UBD8_9HELO|nr:hypothetical protein LSUB1_G001995 [Lachnellula subtilissima]
MATALNSPDSPRNDRNVGFEEGSLPLSHDSSTSTRRKWISRANRSRTDVVAHVESRAFRHSSIVKRPQALHYKRDDDPNNNDFPLLERKLTRPMSNTSGSSGGDGEERSTDDLLKQISRLDLFVDLVWIGIVANLSATFSEQAFTDSGVGIGPAILEFMLLFVPIWRTWDHLRAFCINFFVDDILQRNFIVWILILSVLYGVNAPYAFVAHEVSFLVANIAQAFFIPFLRRQTLFKVFATISSSALWIAAIFVHYPAKIGFLLAANAIEHPVDIFLASPIADAWLTPGWKRTPHIDHYIERHEGFFIIILGEGVFRLMEGSPSGWGLNEHTGTVVIALIMYYLLHWLYFNGDHTKQFVHALRRTWWKPVLWQALHVFMFASLLILAASTLFLVEHQDVKIHSSVDSSTVERRAGEAEPAPKAAIFAIWSASVNLSCVILFMTCISLLNRPLDKPKTLLVNSRWLRIGGRLPIIVIICCLPLIKSLTPAMWIGIVVCLLYAVSFWEWIAGLERNWKLLEPKEE